MFWVFCCSSRPIYSSVTLPAEPCVGPWLVLSSDQLLLVVWLVLMMVGSASAAAAVYVAIAGVAHVPGTHKMPTHMLPEKQGTLSAPSRTLSTATAVAVTVVSCRHMSLYNTIQNCYTLRPTRSHTQPKCSTAAAGSCKNMLCPVDTLWLVVVTVVSCRHVSLIYSAEL